jgi:hypothetical protein
LKKNKINLEVGLMSVKSNDMPSGEEFTRSYLAIYLLWADKKSSKFAEVSLEPLSSQELEDQFFGIIHKARPLRVKKDEL